MALRLLLLLLVIYVVQVWWTTVNGECLVTVLHRTSIQTDYTGCLWLWRQRKPLRPLPMLMCIYMLHIYRGYCIYIYILYSRGFYCYSHHTTTKHGAMFSLSRSLVVASPSKKNHHYTYSTKWLCSIEIGPGSLAGKR